MVRIKSSILFLARPKEQHRKHQQNGAAGNENIGHIEHRKPTKGGVDKVDDKTRDNRIRTKRDYVRPYFTR